LYSGGKMNDSIFEVNRNFELLVTDIGNYKNKLISIKNFLKYPESFREFLLSIPTQETIKEGKSPRGFYPGVQLYLTYNFEMMEDCLRFLMWEHYGYKVDYFNFSFQYIDGNKKVYKQSNNPHCDQKSIAGNLFLNYKDEIDGETGTAFYRLKETGEECFFPNSCMYRKHRYGFTSPDLRLDNFAPPKEDDRYEMYHLSPVEFNTLNLYEGSLFHNSFIEANTFKKHKRMTFSFTG